MKDKGEEKNNILIEEKLKQGGKEHQYSSPPPSSSSPSHEFSFTISLPPSAPPTIIPADDIFSHGHLLPLHHQSHLPHLPVSPRSTANLLDSFTLPIKDLSENRHPCSINNAKNNNNYHHQIQSNDGHHTKQQQQGSRHSNKSKSFSLFGIPKRTNNKCEEESDHFREKEENKKKNHMKRLSFDISHVVNKYMKMVIIPLLSLRSSSGRRSSSRRNFLQQFRNESNNYSFSGHVGLRNIKNKQDLRGEGGRRREFSAPASIRTSPTNSGVLATGETISACSSSDHSTMEELHAAIQAAIAHCKNSVMAVDQLKRPDQVV